MVRHVPHPHATASEAGLIVWMIDPRIMAWAAWPLPTWARWTGAGLLPLACAGLFWTLGSLGPNLTDTVVTRRAHTLVAHVPYRWVRHPFYGAVTVLMLRALAQV